MLGAGRALSGRSRRHIRVINGGRGARLMFRAKCLALLQRDQRDQRDHHAMGRFFGSSLSDGFPPPGRKTADVPEPEEWIPPSSAHMYM